MVQVDLPTAFTFGQVFAFIGRKLLKKEPHLLYNKLIGPFTIFISCGFVPVGIFLLTGWASWQSMYAVQWVENTMNQPLIAGVYVAYYTSIVVLGNIGFILGHYWIQIGKEKFVVIGIILGIIVSIIPFILRWGVWWKVGTFADYQNGVGYSFLKPPIFYGWLFIIGWLVVISILSLLWVQHIVKKHG